MLRAISLIPGLFCLGLSALVVAPALLVAGPRTLEQRWRLIGVVFLSGLLLNYLLIVTVGRLWTGMVAALAIAFGCLILIGVRYGREAAESLRLGAGPTVCFALVIALFGAAILLEPLIGWDARSMWFFHAKMVYYAGGLVKDAGWTWPCCIFSHPDYPMLVPVLAGETASLAGYWNEQLPKFALLLLLAPVLAVTISYWSAGLATTGLLLIVWAKLAPDLCSGYMDGPLAVYGMFGVLLTGSWLATGAPLDLVTGVLLIAVTLGLKNEGSLLAVTWLACVTPAVVLAWLGGKRLLPVGRSDAIGIGCVFLLAVASGGSWLLLREIWGLHNDLHLGLRSLPAIVRRLKDPEALMMIARSTFMAHDLLYAMLIGVCATGLARALQTGGLIEAVFCLAVGAVYLAGIELVYLATPLDLKFHLAASASRTMFLPTMLFLAPIILVLRDERHWRISAYIAQGSGS